MTEQHEAPEAPAPAVEAEQGASQGAPAQSLETPSTNADSVSASNGAQADASSTTSSSAPSSTAPSEEANASGEAHEGDAHDGEAHDGEEGEEPQAGEEGGANAADPLRKKRRRRRRKKPGAREPGEEGAAAVTAEGAPSQEKSERPPREREREGAGGVFARFFDGPNAGKRHAFSAGEVVAGRVVKINDGAFVVDLFGKATAFVDIFEPHEIPVAPEPPAPAVSAARPPASSDAASSDAASPEKAAEGLASEAAEQTGEPEGVQVDAPLDAAATTSAVDAQQPVEDTSALAAVAESALGTQSEHLQSEGSVDADATGTVREQPEATQAQHDAQPGAAPVEGVETAEAQAAFSQSEHREPETHHEESAHEETAAEPEPEPPPPPELGTIFRGRIGSVSESGHVVIVNRIVDVSAAKQRIIKARDQRQRVRGVVYGFNRGGFDVLVEGVRVFCPASGMALTPVDNPEPLLGQRLEFTVPPAKAGTHGLVVSRRGILERQQRRAAKQLFRSLQPGQKLRGHVTQVREFGLFVDLGGFEGLVHQSELSFNRGVRPQDVAKPGDEVEVQVLRVGEGQTRKERERVSLSMKTLQADPWSAQNELLEPGNIITGKVVRTTEFGAFIELAPQIEGLLHISELGRELKHANQALEEGHELRVIVERVDRKARRISLSKLSQAEEKSIESGVDSKSARPPKPGQHLDVVVEKVDHAGLMVQVPGVFGRRGRGFIPNVEMGTERGTDHRRGFPPGTVIHAKVIGVDRDGGFRFSRKALLFEEEKKAVQDYRREASRHGLGTFGDLLRAKLEGGKQGS
jgi:small subunit ribosomal protein S1